MEIAAMSIILGGNIAINVPALLETRALVQANSGGGKSWGLRRILEQTASHVQQLIIDPEGEFATLREKYDYVVAAAHGGDALAHPRTASLLARRLLESGVSAILDIYDLKAHERQAFVRLFCETLVNAPKSLWRPALVVIDEAHVFCLDDQTEILTPGGWRKHHEIDVGHEAITFDLASGTYGRETIQRVIRKNHSGPMVRLQSDGIDCVVTPEHRVVLRREQRGKGRRRLYDWTFCEANRVPHHVYIPTGGAPVGTGCGLSFTQLRTLGWIITDGNLDRTGRYLSISQARNTVKKGVCITEEMDMALSSLGCVGRYASPAKIGNDGIERADRITYYLGVDVSTELLDWLGSEIHRVPREIIESGTREELEALYGGLLEGDGTADKNGWKTFYPGHNEGLADDFQEVALRLGVSTTKKFNVATGQWNVLISKRRHHYIRKPGISQYDGLVWCVTVPSGAFVARRCGKVFVTGNCAEGSKSESTGAVIDLVTRGRKRGFGTILATQRLSKLHKDAAAEMLNKLVGRTGLDIDVKRAGDELGMTARDAMEALRTLAPGEFYAFGPAFATTPTKVKVGPVQTTHPKAGQRMLKAPPAPSAKIRAALAELTDLPAAAEEEEAAIERLKRENAELRRKLTLAERSSGPSEEEIKRRVEEARYQAYSLAMDDFSNVIKETLAKGMPKAPVLTIVPRPPMSDKRPSSDGQVSYKPPTNPNWDSVESRPIREKTRISPKSPEDSGKSPGITGPHAKILSKLAALVGFGIDQPTKETLAAHAGYSPGGGGFGNYLSQLRGQGLIEYPAPGRVSLTENGHAVAGTPEPMTVEDLHRSWFGILARPLARILEVVIDHHPEPVSKDAIAAAVGMSATGGGFGNYVSKLRTLGAIDYPRTGYLCATEAVFPK